MSLDETTFEGIELAAMTSAAYRKLSGMDVRELAYLFYEGTTAEREVIGDYLSTQSRDFQEDFEEKWIDCSIEEACLIDEDFLP